jgi:hypothetical protein
MINRVVDRYFIKEFVPPFIFSLFALTAILLMDQLFRLIDLFVRKGYCRANPHLHASFDHLVHSTDGYPRCDSHELRSVRT